MLLNLVLLSALSLAGGAHAQKGDPCAAVASSSAAYLEAFPAETVAVVAADTAEACLKSVPIDQDENKLLIDELTLYLSWQSNIKYLLDPPDGYTEDRVDILDRIRDISAALDKGTYTNEFQFQLDLYSALQQAYDFHLGFTPDILGLFYFKRANFDASERFSLTSVSADGKALPELYNWFDIRQINNGAAFTPSPIVEINNQTAEDYVNNWAKLSPYHDKDARYNRQFPSQAGISVGDEVNQFVLGLVPDGAQTSVQHKNGSTFVYDNYALVLKDFSNIRTGRDVYKYLLAQGPPTTTQKRSERETLPRAVQRALPTATGYPDPVILHSEGVVGGYYLSGQGLDDVAVLGLPSFSPESKGGGAEFQDVVASFLKTATGAGKKRLIVDLRSNGGGRVFLGYDLFKQLFPKMDPWGATRFRANSAFNDAGIAMTEMLKGYTYEQAVDDAKKGTYSGNLAFAWRSIFNYKVPVTTDRKAFASWQDLFGPKQFNGDNFTSLQRYDFNNFFSDDFDIDVSGYGVRANSLGAQPFDAKNIVILQDGTCGSTCAIFSELMKAQGGVQQIVVGGTPKTGPMQGVAGSKGAQVWDFMQVWEEAANTYNFLSDYQVKLNDTELGQLVFAKRPLLRAAYSSDGTPRARINLRDNIRQGDDSNTPLEFIYEAADCKLWYTPAMIQDPTAVWQATANARWNNNQGCVDGSVGDKSSLSGGLKISSGGSGGKKSDASASYTRNMAAWALVVVATVMIMAF